MATWLPLTIPSKFCLKGLFRDRAQQVQGLRAPGTVETPSLKPREQGGCVLIEGMPQFKGALLHFRNNFKTIKIPLNPKTRNWAPIRLGWVLAAAPSDAVAVALKVLGFRRRPET